MASSLAVSLSEIFLSTASDNPSIVLSICLFSAKKVAVVAGTDAATKVRQTPD